MIFHVENEPVKFHNSETFSDFIYWSRNFLILKSARKHIGDMNSKIQRFEIAMKLCL